MLFRKNKITLIACGILGIFGAGALAHADAVTDWNAITLDAVTAGRPGPIGMVDVALVQAAVHDAVQALDRRYEPYHVEIKGARGRRSAAVAAAAHDMLVGMSRISRRISTPCISTTWLTMDSLAIRGFWSDRRSQPACFRCGA